MDAQAMDKAWETLERLAQGEYGQSLSETLLSEDQALAFRRIVRLFGVYAKEPFARSFAYDPEIPTNWAKSSRYWEIRETPGKATLEEHHAQYSLLEDVALEWRRPVETIAEYNIALSLCRRVRPIVCGEAKALETQEKIAKELEKSGTSVSPFSLNQALGIAAVTMASYLVQEMPILTGHAPIVSGTTLLLMCVGQRRLCKLMKDFEDSDDKKKDRFASRQFYVCGSTSTATGNPCGMLVREPGLRCARHT